MPTSRASRCKLPVPFLFGTAHDEMEVVRHEDVGQEVDVEPIKASIEEVIEDIRAELRL